MVSIQMTGKLLKKMDLGEVLWEKTLNESTVYFSNGIPVYLDLFTLNQESNEKDFSDNFTE